MTREQLEHLLRAAGDISDDDEIIVVGSQAILAQFPDAPAELRVSLEADLYPKNHPDRTDLVDGTIGELSPFHDTFGYYAQGVGAETSVLPNGWESRLVEIRNENTRGVTGLCLEIHDLAIAKAAAGREKDNAFLSTIIEHGLVRHEVLMERLDATDVDPTKAKIIRKKIQSEYARYGQPE